MRGYTHARVNAGSPRSLGSCDRCGFIFNLNRLQWQEQWLGPRLQNIGLLVCDNGCLDKPNEQLRAITLPQDPPSIMNARVEQYTQDDNPYTGLGINIGNMTNAGGLNAAFDGVDTKPQAWCCAKLTSTSSYQNTIGKQWVPAAQPIDTDASDQKVAVTEFTMYAPSNAPFLTSGVVSFYFQGSDDASTWTTLYSATTAGTNAEILTVDSGITTTPYAYHQWVFNGNGSGTIAVAQISITGTGLSGNQ